MSVSVVRSVRVCECEYVVTSVRVCECECREECESM